MTVYCTTQDVATFLGSGVNINDPALAPIVTNINQAVDTYLARNILSATYNESYRGLGTPRFLLNNVPVTAIASLTILGQAILPTTSPFQPGFMFDSERGMVEVVGYGPIPTWPGAISIAYTAGYAAVPDDLVQAAIEWAAFKYKTKDKIGVQSKTLDRETVTYSQHAMPMSVKSTLNLYRDMRIYR